MRVGKIEFVSQIMEMQKERRERKGFKEYLADCEARNYERDKTTRLNRRYK